MFKTLFLSTTGITLASAYYLHNHKFQLQNQYFRSVLDSLHNYNPKLSHFVFKNAIKYCFIKECQSMKSYVFSSGFDFDAFYLQGLTQIGFDTVQVGPVSLIASCSQQPRLHFGSKTAQANINTLHQNKINSKKGSQNTNQQSSQNVKIGVCITPNFEIIKYAPYLIEQNMLNCLRQFEELSKQTQNCLIYRYILKLNIPQMQELQTQEYIQMVKKLIIEAHKSVQSNFRENLSSFGVNNCDGLKKPEIFIELPNNESNPGLFQTVKNIQEVQHIIVDGNQYDVIRKNIQNDQKISKKSKKIDQKHDQTKITLGKRRITFEELLDKVISNTI